MENSTVILSADDIVEKANAIIKKIHHAQLVCNLKDRNRHFICPNRALLCSLIANDSKRYIREDARDQVSRLLCKYDKTFTRLLKGKPSEDEYVDLAVDTICRELDLVSKEMEKENRETTT